MFKIVCIGGPTGVGKDTVTTKLLENELLIRIPRTTTRERRPTEQANIDYYYVSKEEFRMMDQANMFCGKDFFDGHYYGVERHRIQESIKNGKKVLGVFGVCSFELKRTFKNSILVYIMPPGNTIEEQLKELRRRLEHRGDKPEKIKSRLILARDQLLNEPKKFDVVVINDNLQLAVEQIMKIIHLNEHHLLERTKEFFQFPVIHKIAEIMTTGSYGTSF